MTVITAEQAPTFQADATHVVGLAAPSRGAVHTSAWRLTLAPGGASPPHSLTHEEVFVALRGRLEARYDDRVEAVSAVGGQAMVGGETLTPPWAQ